MAPYIVGLVALCLRNFVCLTLDPVTHQVYSVAVIPFALFHNIVPHQGTESGHNALTFQAGLLHQAGYRQIARSDGGSSVIGGPSYSARVVLGTTWLAPWSLQRGTRRSNVIQNRLEACGNAVTGL